MSAKATIIIAKLLEKPAVKLIKRIWRSWRLRGVKNACLILAATAMLSGCVSFRDWAVGEIDEWAWNGDVPEELRQEED